MTVSKSITDGESASLAFIVANAALEKGMNTMVFLMSDGIWAAVEQELRKIDEGEPFLPLKDLVDVAVGSGGKILVCTTCMQKHEVSAGDLIDGAIPAGAADLVDWLSDGSAHVSF